MAPVLLDLYCKAGGMTRGYQRAGFRVVGVDKDPQPNYVGDEFIQADALDVLADRRFLGRFAVIGASPPCQAYSPLGALSPHKSYPDLLAPTRDALLSWGGLWVIENVMTAPLDKARSIMLCAEMFGLRNIRHRRFEPSPGLNLTAPPHVLPHGAKTATKQRRYWWARGWHVSVTGDVGTYVGPEALGIDWMTGDELSEAVPPAYAEYIGRQILQRTALVG